MIFIVYIFIGVVFAFIGAEMAKSRKRDAAIWAVISFLFPLVGVIALAIAGEDKGLSTMRSYVTGHEAKNFSIEQVNRTSPAAEQDSARSSAWKTLKEFDQDIAEAVQKLAPFGQNAEERLAKAYLAVSDKSLLPSMVAKITSDEQSAKAETESKRAEALSKNSKEVLDKLKAREAAAAATIEAIKSSGMMFNGAKVASVKMYDGDDAHDYGFARIVYKDGRIELRAGSTFIAVRHRN